MTPDRLLAHFDRISDAPDAIPRLRKFVLELAVRGKLVPQDHSTVSTYGRSEEVAGIYAGTLPLGWSLTSFGDIAEISGGFAFKSGDYAPSGVFVLRVTNIEPSGRINRDDAVYLPSSKVTNEIERFYLDVGDILLVMVGGSLGKIGVVSQEHLPALLNQNLWRITPANETIDRHFLRLLIEYLVRFQRNITHSTHGHLSREDFRGKQVAIPPIEEQRRIVTKVDELMALCDQLEAAQTERERRRERLAAASLARLNQPADGGRSDEFRAHVRFHLDHLSRLTTRPEQIRRLRTLIFQFAIQGLLSSNRDRSNQIADYWAIPDDWQWVRVEEAGRVQLGRQRAPHFHHGPNMRPYLRVQNVYEARLDLSDVKEMEFSDEDFQKFRLYPGDILLNEGQSYELVGRPAIYRGEVPGACFQNTLVRFQSGNQTTADYALIVFRAFMHLGRFSRKSQQTTNIAHLGAGRFSKMAFPLPPLKEQRHIIAKVDELMAICDKLESHLTTAQTNRRLLLEAVLHEALAPHG